MGFFTNLLLGSGPDNNSSFREDHIRVRNADTPGENLSRQYPLWLSGLFNIFILESTHHTDGLNAIESLFAWLCVLVFSLFLSAIFAMMVQDSAIRGTKIRLFNSYDRTKPKSYIQQRWPGEIYDARDTMYSFTNGQRVQRPPSSQSESDTWKYWSNQKNSLYDFFVISHLIGMFITIAIFVFFISYIEDYYVTFFVANIVLIGYLLFALYKDDKKRNRYRYRR